MNYLRSLRPSDFHFLEKIENDPQFMKYGEFHLPFTAFQLKEFIANSHKNIRESHQYRYVIEYEKEAVGFLDLFDYEPKTNGAFVGIIVVPGHRNKQIAYKSLLELEVICLRDWGISILKAQIGSENLPSIQLFKKLNYQNHKRAEIVESPSVNKPLLIFEKTLI